MEDPDSFVTSDGITVFRLVGQMPLEQAVQQMTSIIVLARQRAARKLLVNGFGLTGFNPPSLGSRYFFVHEWARAAGGQLALAMVVRPEMIDSKKFGVAVAKSAGLQCDIFVTEEEALAWLRNPG